MSFTNLYGEEWEPPNPPIVNVSPSAWSKLREDGFTDWLADDSRESVENFMRWLCERAILLAEDEDSQAFYDNDGNLVFLFAIPDPVTSTTSWWKLTFELLDERASYYDVLRVERMA